MIVTQCRRGARGWTLVEMSVVLVITALLATLVLQVMPLGIKLAEEEVAQQRVAQAEEALLGFARANSRLPEADSDGDGREDTGATDGLLPYVTLGLPAGAPIAYSVSGQLSTGPDGYLYHPSLPMTSSAPGSTPAVHTNGLDLCVLLGNMQRDLDTSAGGSYSAAFAISHRLPTDGINTVPMITLSTPELSADADTSLLYGSTGVGELFTRLNCPSQLNRAFASAQTAATAQSALLLAKLDSNIADFYIEVATIEHALNVASHNLALWNLANALFELELAAVQAIPDIIPPVNAGEVAAALLSLGKAANAVNSALEELDDAKNTMDESEEKINVTRRHADHAAAQAIRHQDLRDAATEEARLMNLQGLNP